MIDAALVLLAQDGDDIVTADHTELEQLARAAGRHVEVIRPSPRRALRHRTA